MGLVSLHVIITFRMRFITIILLASWLATATLALATPELGQLWSIPQQPVAYEVSKTYTRGNLQVEEVYYGSREYKGHPVKIFGYFCYPKGRGKLPGLLICHGGGGTANLPGAIVWAQHGYAVLAIDLPGKGEQRWHSRSGGPDMDVPILLRTSPDPSYNYLIHAVAAVRNGITFLTEREEVNPNRLGMVGLSWGGVITLLTNGQDTRLKAAVNVFGAGFISEGCTWQDRFALKSSQEVTQWETLIDPKNFLATQHAPILFMTGTNDHCYYLPTFQKSYEEITVPKKLVFLPNSRHQFLPYMQAIVFQWLDDKLKNTGRSFPNVQIGALQRKGQRLIIPAIIQSDTGRIKPTLYYSAGPLRKWTTRYWQEVYGFHEDGVWYFGLPIAQVQPDVVFYIQAADDRGAAAASSIRSLLRVQLPDNQITYALSSPIRQVNHQELPLQILGYKGMLPAIRITFNKPQQVYQLVFPAPQLVNS